MADDKEKIHDDTGEPEKDSKDPKDPQDGDVTTLDDETNPGETPGPPPQTPPPDPSGGN